MWFEAWSAADPLGTKLGDLTEAFDKEIQVVHNGEGYVRFKIRQDSAQSGWCIPGTHIRVRWAQGDPFLDFSAFLEEGQDAIISTDEEGGEVYQRGGRGSIVYPESRAIMYNTEDGPAGPAVVDADGNWTYTDIPYGEILNDVISQAKLRTPDPLADLTDGISPTVDGNGNPWPAFDGEFKVGAGMNVYAVEKALQSQGLIIKMRNPLTVKAYATYGQDLSATIHFQKGVNIRESAERQIVARPIRSRVLIQGNDGAFLEVTDAQTAVLEAAGHPVGRREGYTMYRHSSSPAVLTRAGQQYLRKSRAMRNGPTTIGVRWNEFVPWVDYEEGDAVAVTIPGVWSSYDATIEAITVNEDPAGDNLVSLSFENIPYDPASEMQAAINEMIHGPGCKPGCGHGGDGDGGGAGDAEITETAVAGADIDFYQISEVHGIRDAAWAVDSVSPHFEAPTQGVGAGIGEQFNESFARCFPDNDAFKGTGKGYGQIVIDLTGVAEPAVRLGVRLTIDWDKSANSLRVMSGITGTIGNGDGATMLATPGLFEIRALAPGALDPTDVDEGVTIGVIGGTDSGSVDVIVPITHLSFGSATGCRVMIVPLFDCEWAGWSCAGTNFDDARVGVERFIAVTAAAVIREASGVGWISNALLGTRDGVNTDFTFDGDVQEVSDLFLNGLSQPGSAYSYDDTTQTLTTVGWAPLESDLVEARYRIE